MMSTEMGTEGGYTVDAEPVIEERAPGLGFEWLYQLKCRNESALRFYGNALPRLPEKGRIINVAGKVVTIMDPVTDPDVYALRRAHARLEKAARDVRDLELKLKARIKDQVQAENKV